MSLNIQFLTLLHQFIEVFKKNDSGATFEQFGLQARYNGRRVIVDMDTVA